jgi:hypothetical protein
MDRTPLVRLGVLGLLGVTAVGAQRLPAASPGAERAAAPAAIPAPAQTADDAAAPNKIVDMGGTYYTLEAKARKVTMRLPDRVATAERLIDGDLRTTLQDFAGQELARLRVHRKALLVTDLDYNGIRLETTLPLQPTLDWAGFQTIALAKDKAVKREDLEWQGRFIRTRGRKAEVLDDTPDEIAVEFEGGIKAITTKAVGRPEIKTERPLFVTRVFRDNVQVGSTWWIPSTKTFVWKFPGLTEGMVNEERQKIIGGWKFRPTMAWANVQGLAFYEFHSRLAAEGKVASMAPQPGPLARLVELVMPTVSAQNGCNYMHWLDNSVYRPCCDSHDRCYVQSSCGGASWYWPIYGGSWRCHWVCNIGAVACFGTTGICQIRRDCPQFVWGN